MPNPVSTASAWRPDRPHCIARTPTLCSQARHARIARANSNACCANPRSLSMQRKLHRIRLRTAVFTLPAATAARTRRHNRHDRKTGTKSAPPHRGRDIHASPDSVGQALALGPGAARAVAGVALHRPGCELASLEHHRQRRRSVERKARLRGLARPARQTDALPVITATKSGYRCVRQ